MEWARERERKGDQNNPIVICEHVRTGLPVKKLNKKKNNAGHWLHTYIIDL